MFGDVTSYTRSRSEGLETEVPGVQSEGLPHGEFLKDPGYLGQQVTPPRPPGPGVRPLQRNRRPAAATRQPRSFPYTGMSDNPAKIIAEPTAVRVFSEPGYEPHWAASRAA